MAKQWCILVVLALAAVIEFQCATAAREAPKDGLKDQKNFLGYGGFGGYSGVGANGLPFGGGGGVIAGNGNFGTGPGGGIGGAGGLPGVGGGVGTGIVPFP